MILSALLWFLLALLLSALLLVTLAFGPEWEQDFTGTLKLTKVRPLSRIITLIVFPSLLILVLLTGGWVETKWVVAACWRIVAHGLRPLLEVGDIDDHDE